jgi:hypothetical protein
LKEEDYGNAYVGNKLRVQDPVAGSRLREKKGQGDSRKKSKDEAVASEKGDDPRIR